MCILFRLSALYPYVIHPTPRRDNLHADAIAMRNCEKRDISKRIYFPFCGNSCTCHGIDYCTAHMYSFCTCTAIINLWYWYPAIRLSVLDPKFLFTCNLDRYYHFQLILTLSNLFLCQLQRRRYLKKIMLLISKNIYRMHNYFILHIDLSALPEARDSL